MTFAEHEDPQVLVFPTVASLELTKQTTMATPKEAGDHNNNADPEKVVEFIGEVQTNVAKIAERETPAPQPPRGDGPTSRPQVWLLCPIWSRVCYTLITQISGNLIYAFSITSHSSQCQTQFFSIKKGTLIMLTEGMKNACLIIANVDLIKLNRTRWKRCTVCIGNRNEWRAIKSCFLLIGGDTRWCYLCQPRSSSEQKRCQSKTQEFFYLCKFKKDLFIILSYGNEFTGKLYDHLRVSSHMQ